MRKIKHKLGTILSFSVIPLLILSCATTGGKETDETGIPKYYGYGEGSTQTQALNMAKVDAIRKAVTEMIGIPSEAANREKLEKLLYNSGSINAYVLNDTLKIISRSGVEENWQVDIMIGVNLKAVENLLRDNQIWGGKLTPGSPMGSGAKGAKGSPPPTKTAVTTELPPPVEEPKPPAAISPKEQEFIKRYVDKMTYMVYFNEKSGEDPFLMKSAVGIANKYLASQGRKIIDFEQIESLKKDREMVYEEQTGQAVGIIQWIAGRLNADVYIEIDGSTSGQTEGGRHYGKAMITLKIFEASTGTLLGSVPYSSPRTFSQVSIEDAVNNALQSSVYKAMPIALEQAKRYMQEYLTQGIRYELVIENTPDARVMNDFRKRLERKVKDIKTVSASIQQSIYHVYIIGTVEDLEELIYDVAETVPGLEGMYRVLLRGKSITFDTGM